jgi:hypothetical protein
MIGLLGIGLWLFRKEIAQRVAIAELEREGLGPAALIVEDIGFSFARATGIAIGPAGGIHASSLEIDYSLSGLLNGRVGTLRIEGLRARGRLDEKADISVPALDPVLGGGSGGGPAIPALPFERIDLRDFVLTLETSGAPTVIAGSGMLRQAEPDAVDFSIEISDLHTEWDERVTLSGTVRGTDDGSLGLDGRMEGTIAAPEATLSFDAALTGAMADAEISAKAVFSRLDLNSSAFQADGISGEIAYETRGDLPQTISMELDLPKARLFGTAIGPGHVSARRNGTEIAVTADLDSEAGRFALDAEGDPENPDESLTFTLDGALDPALLAALLDIPKAPAGTILVAANGTLAIPKDLAGRDTPELTSLLDAMRMAATVSPRLTDFDLPRMFKAASLSGDANLSVGDRNVALSFLPGFGLTGLIVDPGLAGRLPPDIAEGLVLGAERELAVSGDAPLRLTVAPTEAGYTLTASGEVAGHGPKPNPRLAIEGAMALDSEFVPSSMVAHSIDASVTGFRHAGVAGDLGIRFGNVKSIGGTTTGGFALRLRGDGQPAPGVALEGATVDLDGQFRYAEQALALTAEESSRLTLAGLRIDGEPVTSVPIALRIRSGTISVPGSGASDPDGIAYDLRLAHSDLALSIPDDDGPTPLTLERGGMHVTGGSDSLTLGWNVPAGTIDDLPIAFEDLALNAAFHGLSGEPTGTARLRSKLRHLAEKEAVLPLALVVNARMASELLSATAMLNDAGDRIHVTGEARHDFASGSGEATFDARRIEFLETVLQPEDLFPTLADLNMRVDGMLDLTGSATWSAGSFDSGMELALDFPSIINPEAILKDVGGVIVFDSLSPLTTPPDQAIYIGYADVGVPLESGRLVLHVKPGPIVRAEANGFDLYGGQVYVDPLDYDPSDDQIGLVLGVAGVRIEDLLAPARLGTLEATGVLDGRIPIVVRDGELVISGGVLESVSGGRIRYIPEEVGEAVSKVDRGTALFLDAVSNFEYSVFRVTIDEAEDEDMVLGLEIKGSNPTVYKGVPIVLNIAISGEVREVLYSGLSTYGLPEKIAAALERFGE